MPTSEAIYLCTVAIAALLLIAGLIASYLGNNDAGVAGCIIGLLVCALLVIAVVHSYPDQPGKSSQPDSDVDDAVYLMRS